MSEHPAPNPISLGYLLPTREQIMRGVHDTAPLLDAARHAETLGFDSLWVGDSLFARPRHDPLTLLAALATATQQPRLGTAVLLPALRNPVLLAQQLATIDQLSSGRLIVGAGIAADAPPIHAEFRAAGVPFEKRVGRFVEGFNLCRALWRGEPVDWDGRWTLEQATLAPQPVQPGGPPIWLASSVDAGVARAARLFDGWFPIGPDAATIARQQQLLEATAAAADRPRPATAVYLTLCIDDDAKRAEQAIDDYLTDYYQMPAAIMRRVQACCGGTETQIVDFLQSFVDAGADHLVLRIVGDQTTSLRTLAQLKELLQPR
ncbi:MAG: LLM class flavin-dependent oxidoreductase [Pseudomonadota bacterium]